MDPFQGILHFLVYLVLIYFGAHFAEIKRVKLGKCLIVAIVAFLFSLPLGFLFGRLTLLPLIGWIFGVALGFLFTAWAAKAVFKTSWKSSYTLGLFVVVGSIILKVIGGVLKFVGGAVG